MLRELAVFLCLAGSTFASHLRQGHYESLSSTTPALDVQSPNTIPLEAKILQSQLALRGSSRAYSAEEKNGAVYQEILSDEQNSYSSPRVTYSISPAVVNSVPIPPPVANKVTVEAHEQITAHPPTATQVVAQPEYTVPLVQVTPKPVVSVTTLPPPSTIVTSTLAPQPIDDYETIEHRPAIQYAQDVQPQVINTVSAIPVAENKVTIESHQSVTAHPPPAPRPVYNVVDPPAVEIVSGSVAPTVSTPIPISTSIVHESVTAQAPSASYITSTVAPQPISPVQTIVNPSYDQYVSAPLSSIGSVVVKPKTETVEAYGSVIRHPPAPLQPVQTVINSPSVEYYSSPVSYPVSPAVVSQGGTIVQSDSSLVQYDSSPSYLSSPVNPIPVPVIYNTQAQNSQYVTVNRPIQPVSTIISHQTPVAFPQSLPVAYPKSSAFINYNSRLPSPVVYTKSIVDRDHVSADLVATRITPGYGGYARAVAYSPASAVSSVSFNGLGVSYGW